MVSKKELKAREHYYTVAKSVHGSKFKSMNPEQHKGFARMFSTFAVKGKNAFCVEFGHPDAMVEPSKEEIMNKAISQARNDKGGRGAYVRGYYKFTRNYTPEEADEFMVRLLGKYPGLAGLKNVHEDFKFLVAKHMEKRGNSWAIKNEYR
ncbi:hypothetical protein ACFLQ2_00335 [archaeon]